MNVLILYASHAGATRSCADILEEKLLRHNSVTKVEVGSPLPSPDGFDAVVIGSPIRMGSMDKRLKKYIVQHISLLSSIPTCVFFCCGYPRQFDEYVDTQIPKELTCSLGVRCFGGELKPEKCRGLDKLVVRIARNGIRGQDFEESDADHHELPEIIPENIEILVKEIEKL